MQIRTVPKWWLDNLREKYSEVVQSLGSKCAIYVEDEWVILVPKEEVAIAKAKGKGRAHAKWKRTALGEHHVQVEECAKSKRTTCCD